VLIVVAVGLFTAGIIYFGTPAQNLPTLFPGHQDQGLRHREKYGVVAMGLAALVLVGAWFTTATRQSEDSN